MAKKERQKRAARKERQAKRLAREAAIAQQSEAAKGGKGVVAPAKKQQPAKADPNKKPGLVKRAGTYLGEVRSEMRRVVWPSRTDLKNYTIAVIVMLIVFGLAIWLIDTGVVAGLVGYSGLRG